MSDNDHGLTHKGLYYMPILLSSERFQGRTVCEPHENVSVGFRFVGDLAEQVDITSTPEKEKLWAKKVAVFLLPTTVLFLTKNSDGRITGSYSTEMSLVELARHFTWTSEYRDDNRIDGDFSKFLSAYQKAVVEPEKNAHRKSDGFVAVFPVHEDAGDAGEKIYYRAKPYKTEQGEINVSLKIIAGGDLSRVIQSSDMTWQRFSETYNDKEGMPLNNALTAEVFLEGFDLTLSDCGAWLDEL